MRCSCCYEVFIISDWVENSNDYTSKIVQVVESYVKLRSRQNDMEIIGKSSTVFRSEDIFF